MQLPKPFLLPILAFTFVGFWVVGCDEKTEITRQKLVGDWRLVKGLKNDRETGLLEGTVFSFSETGQMTTNLPVGIESPAPFEVEKNTIHQNGRHTIDYSILNISDSSLILGLKMRGMEFEMHLQKFVPVPDSLKEEVPETEI